MRNGIPLREEPIHRDEPLDELAGHLEAALGRRRYRPFQQALPAGYRPADGEWLGFVIEMDGVRIYHAGDTDFIPEMKDFTVDIALLPVSGTYVMTAEQAVKAALAIQPKLELARAETIGAGSASDVASIDLDAVVSRLLVRPHPAPVVR